MYCLSLSEYQVNCFSTSLIGYLVNFISAKAKCKGAKLDEISDKLSTHKFTVGQSNNLVSNEYEATSEAECAQDCRKTHNGECPFFITEYSLFNNRAGGKPGKCTRTLPTGKRNCNSASDQETSEDVYNLLFNTQNLGICVFL